MCVCVGVLCSREERTVFFPTLAYFDVCGNGLFLISSLLLLAFCKLSISSLLLGLHAGGD